MFLDCKHKATSTHIYLYTIQIIVMKKIERQKTLPEIRTFTDDPYSMKGDPLEVLGQLFDFIAVVFGLGIVMLVVELIMYLNK